MADFGFSSDAHSQSFQISASAKGTSGYRAPELLEDSGYYNAKVDIWALGCILYELATNKKAFLNDWAVYQTKTSGSIPDIDLDEAFDDNDKASIINSIYCMLQIAPNSRPSSARLAQEFASNIDSLRMVPPLDVQIDQHFQMKARTVGQEVDNPMSIDHSPSPVDHAVPTIIAQSSEHNHLAADNSPVASQCAHPASKRANPAEIQRYNEYLLLAARTGNVEDMRQLLRAGANIESKDWRGWTPLILVAESGHLEAVKFLVKEGGANVESKDSWDKTPLSWAAENGHLEAVKFLVEEAGADVESKDRWEGWTPLILAAENGHLEAVKFLVDEGGADVESKDLSRMTPLSWAAYNGHLEVVKFLVEEAGADVELKDVSQMTPLTQAAKNGHLDIVKFLVREAGADVESKDFWQRTPLSRAAEYGHLEAVKFLVKEAGADVASKDKQGQTALDLVRQGWAWGNGEARKAAAAWLESRITNRGSPI